MKYVVAMFPSKEIQAKVDAFRKRYDSHYPPSIPPHVTLKEAFQAEEHDIGELMEEMNRIAQSSTPIDYAIKKVSTFAPVSNTIYLKIEPNEKLEHLVHQLHSGKFPSEIAHPFVPHITISQKLNEKEYADVLASSRLQRFNFTDTFNQFYLLYQLENRSWTVYETFLLGGNYGN